MTLKLGYKKNLHGGMDRRITFLDNTDFLLLNFDDAHVLTSKIPRINFILETNLSAVPLYLRDNALHSGAYGAMHITVLTDPDTYVCSRISSQAHFLFLRRKPLPASNSFSLASHRKYFPAPCLYYIYDNSY